MDKNIRNILDDLYAVDKSLKKHEAELIEIIEKLLAAKPNIKFDEKFKSQLRAELLKKFQTSRIKKINFSYMNKLVYTFGALVLIIIVLVPTLLIKDKEKSTATFSFNTSIRDIGSDAFGSLASNDMAATSQSGEAIGLGGGGGFATKPSDIGVPYQPVNYRYIYEGQEFSVEGSQMAVLKRIKGISSQSDFTNIIKSLHFDNINLSSLDNVKLRNFTVYEDKNFGYSVNVDLYEGMISINEYWENWPIYRDTNLSPLNINDIPADSALIAMANKFLQDKNISTAIYGQPEVDNTWRLNYERYENKVDFAIPDMATIVYPLVVEGKKVYDESGNSQGLRVAINLRYNKVIGVWNLNSQKYQSSLYDMETDVNKILDMASRGGVYYPVLNEDSRIVEIKLGAPHRAYVQTWHSEGSTSSELLVPALVFPITDIPDEAEYFYRKAVVIPLAKDIINQRTEVMPLDAVPEPAEDF